MNWNSLEQLVPSLDLCQKLKAAGFPQGAAHSYYKNPRDTFGIVEKTMAVGPYCAAPTAEEILTALPRTILKGQIYVLEAQRRGDVLDVWETDWYFNGLQLAASTTDTISGSLAESAAFAYLWWKAKP